MLIWRKKKLKIKSAVLIECLFASRGRTVKGGEVMEEKENTAIAGHHPVREALLAGTPLNKIYYAAGQAAALKDILSLARERGIPLIAVEKQKLQSMVPGVRHQGVVALAAPRAYVDMTDILVRAGEDAPFILLLNEINDPHNLGAILRTADAVGVHGVVIPKRRAAPLTPAVAKSAAGALEHVPVARVTNMVQAIKGLKEAGLWVAGAHPAGRPYWQADLSGPLALVVGGEDKGLGRLVEESCDFLVSIPMYGRVSSLNASVAAALLLYEVRRQRGESRP